MLDDAYAHLLAALREQADLQAALHLLEWDQETFMPAGTVESRARQIGTLAAVLHERHTDPRFLDLVDDLAGQLSQLTPEQAVDVRETKWRLDRERALDLELVRARSTLHAHGRAAWSAARRAGDFGVLAPFLERIVDTERRVAAAIDASRPAYDVLLEGYEPGMTTAVLDALFATLCAGLRPLVERIRDRHAARPQCAEALCGHFPADTQRRFGRAVARHLGFDFTKGRLDEALHPSTTSIGADVRLTTRYDEGDLRYALFSTIHETGHGLYEQGLDPALHGTPRGQSCSLGVHESQSRLWENQVGRSAAFWRWLLPIAAQYFPSLRQQSLDAVLLAVNEARPSLIRTEADEVTYNLHIVMRFELERALIDGSLAIRDLPAAWDERMRSTLGVSPPTDRDGVLQDVHWASGAIGYFPTYTLGNVYAAQLLRAAKAALGPPDAALGAGELDALLHWLREHVHGLGQTYRAPQLIELATGQPPNPDPLLEHLRRKVAWLENGAGPG
jgi:carboxypeptidase Taq